MRSRAAGPAGQGRSRVRVGVVSVPAEDAAAVCQALAADRRPPALQEVGDLDALRRLLARARLDVVVCGHAPPAVDGLRAVAAVRQLTAAVPVVVYARAGDEAAAVAAIKAGAADYVPAPAPDDELRRVLGAALTATTPLPCGRPTARFEQLLDQLDIGTYRALPDARIIEANDATRRIMRHPTLASLLRYTHHPTYLSAERRALWRTRIEAEGVVRRETERVRCPDGSTITIEGDARAVRDERGRFVCFEGYLRDITEREAAMAQLELQARLLEQVRHVVVATGPDFMVSYWNRHAERLLQRTADEVIGGDVARALGLDDPDAMRAKVDATLQATGYWEGVLEAHKKDGTPVVLHARGSRLDAAGVMVGYLGTYIDITEHRRLEQELERTLAVRDRLVHDVRHRVRRNLQMVSRLLRAQQARSDDPAWRSLFRESGRRIRAIALIHDWLSPTAGQALVNMRDYLEHLVTGLQASTSTPGGPRVACKAEPLLLDLDAAVRIGLVVNELVTNALEHAFPGGRSGNVSVRLSASAAGGVALAVEDDGVGLPPAFDLDATPTLGLQLVRNLTSGLQATVQIERAGGTRIRIECPPPLTG